MRRTILFVLFMISAAACKGKESKKADTPNVASGTATGSTTATASDDAAAARPPAPSDERCASPCRFLAETPLAEIGDKFKAACNADWKQVGEQDCQEFDYQRNCIFATAGYTFRKKRYQDAFGKEPWYKPRADFKEADLSKVALANVGDLKKRAEECRTGGVIDEKDRKIVDAWLAKLRAGKPEIPEIVIGYFDATPADIAKRFADGKKAFSAKQQKGMRYVEKANLSDEWVKPLDSKTVRKFVEVDFSEPDDGGCGGEECGYGLWLTLAIDDKDQIIGLEEMGAACPAVYLGDRYQGEILRHLAYPEHEGTQSLAVFAPCSGSVTYRIAEEKQEVTYLDELVLVIGGETIFPSRCGPLCANDGRAHVLTPGDVLDVTFEIPAGLACGGARLVANGHYVPRSP